MTYLWVTGQLVSELFFTWYLPRWSPMSMVFFKTLFLLLAVSLLGSREAGDGGGLGTQTLLVLTKLFSVLTVE